MMSQLVRTPKFLRKIEKDLLFLKNMPVEEFKQSIMNAYLVQRPKDVNKEILMKIHENMILYNTLENVYKWSKIVLITNHTHIPFITSDSPVIYNNINFLPSYLGSKDRIEFTILWTEYSQMIFPLDPNFAIMISDRDNKREEAIIDYEDVFDERAILMVNMLIYQYSERMVFMKNKDRGLINVIRKTCGNDLNKEYLSLEVSYKFIEDAYVKMKEE